MLQLPAVNTPQFQVARTHRAGLLAAAAVLALGANLLVRSRR